MIRRPLLAPKLLAIGLAFATAGTIYVDRALRDYEAYSRERGTWRGQISLRRRDCPKDSSAADAVPYRDSLFVVRSPGLAELVVGFITEMNPDELVLRTDSGLTLFERSVVRRVSYDWYAHVGARKRALCPIIGGWLSASTTSDADTVFGYLAKSDRGAALRLRRHRYPLPGSANTVSLAWARPEVIDSLRRAWSGNAVIQRLLRDEERARKSDTTAQGYRVVEYPALMPVAEQESSAAVLHLTHNSSPHGTELLITVMAYMDQDTSYGMYDRLLARWGGTPLSSAEVLAVIPGGGAFAPLAKKAPTAAAILAGIVGLALIARTIAGAYESLIVRRVERQLGLMKLQLDITSSLVTLSPDSSRESAAPEIAELRGRFRAMAHSLRRRATRADRLVGRRAFWRWPDDRRIRTARRWQRYLVAESLHSRPHASRHAGYAKLVGHSAVILGGLLVLVSYGALLLIGITVAQYGDEYAEIAVVAAVAVVWLVSFMGGYSAIRWGQAVLRGVRKWRRQVDRIAGDRGDPFSTPGSTT